MKIFKIMKFNDYLTKHAPGVLFEFSGDIFTGIHIIIYKKLLKEEWCNPDFGDRFFKDYPSFWIRLSLLRPMAYGWRNFFCLCWGKAHYNLNREPLINVNVNRIERILEQAV